MAVGRLGGDLKRPSDLFCLQPTRKQSDDLRLALGQSGRPLNSRYRLSGGLENRGRCSGVESPRSDLLIEIIGGLLWCQGGAVRPWLRHCVIHVRGGEQRAGGVSDAAPTPRW